MTIQVRFLHHPKFNNWLKNQGYSREEEGKIYDDNLQDVIDNPRWYLDNLEFLVAYRVRWATYKGGEPAEILKTVNPTIPIRFVEEMNEQDKVKRRRKAIHL